MSLKPLLSEVFDFFSFALDAGEKPVFSFTVATVIDRAQQIGMNEIVHASSPGRAVHCIRRRTVDPTLKFGSLLIFLLTVFFPSRVDQTSIFPLSLVVEQRQPVRASSPRNRTGRTRDVSSGDVSDVSCFSLPVIEPE